MLSRVEIGMLRQAIALAGGLIVEARPEGGEPLAPKSGAQQAQGAAYGESNGDKSKAATSRAAETDR